MFLNQLHKAAFRLEKEGLPTSITPIIYNYASTNADDMPNRNKSTNSNIVDPNKVSDVKKVGTIIMNNQTIMDSDLYFKTTQKQNCQNRFYADL